MTDLNDNQIEQNDNFDELVKKKCLSEPLINKIIQTEEFYKKYTLTVKLYKANYGNFLYWNVKCNKTYQNTQEDMMYHPFRKLRDIQVTDNIGEVVANNEITTTLMKYLAMEDDELANHTGNTSLVDYRAKIIACMEKFWD